MKKLDNNELKNVKGGIGFWGIAGIISAAIFIVGVVDGIARPLKCEQKKMKRLTEEELILVVGGFNITGTIVNAFVSAGKFLIDSGRRLGTAIRRISGNNMCSCR